MSKNKICAVCEDPFDDALLVGIMDTYICQVCTQNMDTLMKEELGDDYKKGLPRTTTRQAKENKVVIDIYSPIHPVIEPEPTTA